MFKEKNAAIRNQIFKSVEGLSDEKLNEKPGQGKWSPIQILDHLHRMESVITENISKELESGNSKKTFKKPIQLTISRTFKVEAPSYTVPSEEFMELDVIKKKLNTSREYLNSLYDNTTQELMKKKSLPHPVFGKVPMVQWFPFVGLHEKRHFKQLEKTLSEINEESK